MKEAEYRLDDFLRGGVRPDETIPRNVPTLLELRNMRPGKAGLKPIEPPVSTNFSSYSVSWPFPQIFISNRMSFLITSTTIYTFDEDFVFTNQYTISSTTPWHVAMAGGFAILTDGTTQVYYNPATNSVEACE